MKKNNFEKSLNTQKSNVFYKIKQWFKKLFFKPDNYNLFEEKINKKENNKENTFTDKIKVDSGIETRRRKKTY